MIAHSNTASNRTDSPDVRLSYVSTSGIPPEWNGQVAKVLTNSYRRVNLNKFGLGVNLNELLLSYCQRIACSRAGFAYVASTTDKVS
jgi:hypothetical protein